MAWHIQEINKLMRKYIKAQQSPGRAALINPSAEYWGALTVVTRCSGTEVM